MAWRRKCYIKKRSTIKKTVSLLYCKLFLILQKSEMRQTESFKIGTEHFGITPNVRETNQNCIVVRWNSETVCNYFYKEFGQYCDGKHVSEKYIGDIDIACGLIDSDGSVDSHGAIRLVLKNKCIIMGATNLSLEWDDGWKSSYSAAARGYIFAQGTHGCRQGENWKSTNETISR